MPRLLRPVVAVASVTLVSAVGWGQTHDVPLAPEELSCSFCHTCEEPTQKHPCLRACPRASYRVA